jgi:hypothetical protein
VAATNRQQGNDGRGIWALCVEGWEERGWGGGHAAAKRGRNNAASKDSAGDTRACLEGNDAPAELGGGCIVGKLVSKGYERLTVHFDSGGGSVVQHSGNEMYLQSLNESSYFGLSLLNFLLHSCVIFLQLLCLVRLSFVGPNMRSACT